MQDFKLSSKGVFKGAIGKLKKSSKKHLHLLVMFVKINGLLLSGKKWSPSSSG